MRWCLLLLSLIALSTTAWAGDGVPAFMYDSLAGVYTVVGKAPGGDRTYSGTAVVESKGDHIIVKRLIDGESTAGIGKIEPAGADRVNVVRVRFQQKGTPFEITYLLVYDLDNYARLSGYVYPVGKKTVKPGLETLFIDQ